MRRKNWINKKNHFYGKTKLNLFFFNIFLKKKEFKYDEYNTKGQLYKVFIKKNKLSLLTPELNYYFYSDFFKNLKKRSKNIIYQNYVKNTNNNNILLLLPSFMFKSQFFNNKSLFDDVLINHKLKGFFIHKNFYKDFYSSSFSFYKKHLTGYNYFILKSNLDKYLNIYKILDDKDYNSVGKVKLFLENYIRNNSNLGFDINLFFFFNVFLLKMLEIYKIIIFLYIKIL